MVQATDKLSELKIYGETFFQNVHLENSKEDQRTIFKCILRRKFVRKGVDWKLLNASSHISDIGTSGVFTYHSSSQQANHKESQSVNRKPGKLNYKEISVINNM